MSSHIHKEKKRVASFVTLPAADEPYPSLVDFLCEKFPHIEKEVWIRRIADKKVFDDKGHPVTTDTAYVPHMRLRYFREVREEPEIPFEEHILFQDAYLLVADKPHFLPVTPSGPYVRQSLLSRLMEKTGNAELSPIHRIDKDTAGVVVFSCMKSCRGAYQQLFDTRNVVKKYEAVGLLPHDLHKNEWTVNTRIEKGAPFFRMACVPGRPNSESRIRCLERKGRTAYFEIEPKTGKKHQIRLHLCEIGSGILNDRYYPRLLPEAPPDFSAPLKLLAREIQFTDPLTGKVRRFRSLRHLE